MSVKNKEWYVNEYLKCALDPVYCAKHYAKVIDKTQNNKKVPFELFGTQLKVIDGFIKHEYNLVHKYRQAGISTTAAWYIAHKLNFTPDFKVAIVANKLGTARDEVFKKVVNFIEALPDFLRTTVSEKKDASDYKIYNNGSEIKAVAAGKQGLRGYSPNLILLDECAFFEYGSEFWSAAGGSLSAGGGAIFVSTPNGLDELYYKTYAGAKTGKNNFNVIEIKWYQDPRYNKGLEWVKQSEKIKTKDKGDLERYLDSGYELLDSDEPGEYILYRREKRVQTNDPQVYTPLIKEGYKPTSEWYVTQCAVYNNDPKKIAAEIDNSFLGSGANLVDVEIIERQNVENVRTPIRKEKQDTVWVWEDPIPGQKYILGGDVSLGTSDDFSTIQVIKVMGNYFEQVLEFQGKVHPDTLGAYIYEYGTAYNAYSVVDITGGAGISTISTLFQLDFPKKLFHYDEIRSPEIKKRMAEFGTNEDEYPGMVIGVNRPLMLNDFEKYVRDNEFVIRSARTIEELKTFIIKDGGKAEHMRGYNDDLIFGIVMPLYAYKYAAGKVESADRTRKMIEGIKIDKNNDENSINTGRPNKNLGAMNNFRHQANANHYKQYGWLFGK